MNNWILLAKPVERDLLLSELNFQHLIFVSFFSKFMQVKRSQFFDMLHLVCKKVNCPFVRGWERPIGNYFDCCEVFNFGCVFLRPDFGLGHFKFRRNHINQV